MGDSELLEISDLIVDFDVASMQRQPVVKQVAIDRLLERGQRRASKVVVDLPEKDGVLVESAVDEAVEDGVETNDRQFRVDRPDEEDAGGGSHQTERCKNIYTDQTSLNWLDLIRANLGLALVQVCA